jgi:NitT/TauT family transport system substrate-binding protein
MKWTRWLVLGLSLSIVAAACSGDDSGDDDNGTTGATSSTGVAGDELTNLSFRLDWIVDGSHTCFYNALSQGYFRDEGLEVEILEGAGSGTAATLVANGTDDFGFADAGVMAAAINDGAPIRMVAGIFQRTPSIIVSMVDSNINAPEDLVGKSVGAATTGAPLQLLPAYLNANGVNPDDVSVVNMDPAAEIPALLEGRVDALVAYSSSELPILETEAPGQTSVQYYADYGVVTLSNGVITSQEMIENDPETVAAFARAVQRGFEDCEADPAAAVQRLVDRFPQTVNPDAAAIALEEVLKNLHTDRTADQPVGYMDPEDWTDTLATLEQYAGLSEPQPPETYYTNEFVSG